jgi:hypothetical protein
MDAIAMLKQGRKLRKHDVAELTSVRKNRKRVACFTIPATMYNTAGYYLTT